MLIKVIALLFLPDCLFSFQMFKSLSKLSNSKPHRLTLIYSYHWSTRNINNFNTAQPHIILIIISSKLSSPSLIFDEQQYRTWCTRTKNIYVYPQCVYQQFKKFFNSTTPCLHVSHKKVNNTLQKKKIEHLFIH